MGFTCAVADCKNSRKDRKARGCDLLFHKFPKNKNLRVVWVTKCKRGDGINPSHGLICSDHFLTTDYERDLKQELIGLPLKKKLKASAVPSVFKERGQVNVLVQSGRSNRAEKRERSRIVQDILTENSIDESTKLDRQEPIREDSHDLEKENNDPVSHADFFNDDDDEEMKTRATESTNNPTNNSCLQCSDYRNRILDLESQLKTASYVIQCHQTETQRLEEDLRKFKSQAGNNTEGCFSKYFSSSQLKKMRGQSRVNWSTDDIVKALSVRSVSLKAYETIRTVFKLPIPASRTLSTWSQRFSCNEGCLAEVISIIGEAVSKMGTISTFAVLSFDEISLDSTAVIDPTFGNISSQSKAQVMFVRGLCCPWKQPVYYKFDQNVTKTVLFDLIHALELAGIRICSTVCDLGPTNLKLFRELGIDTNSTYFPNPVDPSRQVFVFADIPHCLKNLRNHVLDHGAVLPHGHIIDKSVLWRMVQANGTELKLVKNFDESTLEISGPQRMRVRSAVQFFSHSMASLAWHCYQHKPEFGNFFDIINNGFDTLNSRVPHDKKNRLRSGFGLFYDDQVEALKTLQDTIENLRFRTPKGNKRNALLPCQQGFLISIKSLLALHSSLRTQHNVSYILTCRLNQDSLESLFGRIRSFGGPNTHPTAVEFRYRLKLVLLGGSTKPIKGCNVTEDYGTDYLSRSLLEVSSKETNRTAEEDETEDFDNMVSMARVSIFPQNRKNGKKVVEFNEVEGNSLLYLAGYICWKLSRKGATGLGIRTRDCNLDSDFYEKTWLGILSKGGLYIPTDHVLNTVRICETEFRHSFECFSTSKYCDKKLFHYVRRLHPTIDVDILREFIRVRLRIRVKYINKCKQIKTRSKEMKIKQFKKSKK